MKKSILSILLSITIFGIGHSQNTVNQIKPRLINTSDTVLPTANTFLLEVKFKLPKGYPYDSCIGYQYGKDTAFLNLNSNRTYNTMLNIERSKLKFLVPAYNDFEIQFDNNLPNKKYSYEINLENQIFKIGEIRYDFGKPVIYLYPKKEIIAQVELNFNGELFFTYPEYNNKWNCTAQPDGTLKINNQLYSYLFWEGKTIISPEDVTTKYGQNISTDTIISYFENTLNHLGFTYQEKEDFITYWVPKMIQFDNVFIYFWDERYNDYADLKINPEPDNLYKLFMLWSPCSKKDFKDMHPQILKKIKRSGFFVLEWGGTMVNKSLFQTELKN